MRKKKQESIDSDEDKILTEEKFIEILEKVTRTVSKPSDQEKSKSGKPEDGPKAV